MKFKVLKVKSAQKEFEALSKEQQKQLNSDYEIIEKQGIEYVKRRSLGNALFEIKTNDLRSLFKYADGQIIVIGVIYEKQSQKAPQRLIKLAHSRIDKEI